MSKLFGILLLFALVSCGNSNPDVQYFPYQDEKEGLWGVFSPKDGKPLFEPEFKNKISVVLNDRFVVENNNGKKELFVLSEKPKQVGDAEYKAIGAFIEDVTPCVRSNSK